VKQVVAALLLVAGSAVADGTRIEVPVGDTIEVNVGYAIGALCDDTSIITVDMRTHEGRTNVFAITGIKEGSTLCRVGTDVTRPGYLFEVHVVPAKKKR
jgi:hypothetical protein